MPVEGGVGVLLLVVEVSPEMINSNVRMMNDFNHFTIHQLHKCTQLYDSKNEKKWGIVKGKFGEQEVTKR